MDMLSHSKLWNHAYWRIVDIREQELSREKEGSRWQLPASSYLFVTEGTASARLDDMSLPLKPFTVVHGGKGGFLELHPESRLHYYLIMYKASLSASGRRDLLDLMAESNPFQARYSFQAADPLYLLDKTKRMYAGWRSGSELDRWMVRSLFIQFVHEALVQLERERIAVLSPDPVSQSVRYIEEHYREPITLELLGELLNCSPRQLLRRFRSERNVSPIDYLIGTRLRKAKQLLTTTEAQLKEIAESVGYADSYYFSRLFKKHVGVSPAHYREQVAGTEGRPYNPLGAASSSIVGAFPEGYSDNGFDNHYQHRGEEEAMMYNHSKKSVMAFVIYLSLLLTACGNSGAATGEASPTPSATPTAATSGESGAEATPAETKRTIKHAMGEAVVEGTPQRVVILTNEGTEALLALGVKPIAAVQSWYHEPWYDHIEEDMQDVVVLGDEFQPNIELIASLKPDLIIGNKARQEDIYEQLKPIAPTVFSDDLLGDWKLNFALYAEALNLEEKGAQLMEEFDQRVEEAKLKLGGKLEAEVSIVRFLPTQVRIYQKETFSGVLLDQLGFARPASQDVDDFIQVISKEAIPDMDGDVLFYFVTEIPGSDDTSKVVEEWLNDPLFQNLEAYKNNRVVEVSEAIWNSSGGYKAANLMLDELVAYFEAY